jgi:hypothetical protein
MPDIHQQAHDNAVAARDAAQAAEAYAGALSGARVEVERRELEVSDRRETLADASLEPLARQRLETALQIGLDRLRFAEEALRTIEGEHPE